MSGDEHSIGSSTWLHVRHLAFDDKIIFDDEYSRLYAIEQIRVLATHWAVTQVAAFVILENEFQLLVKIADEPTALSTFMRSLTGRLTAYYNSRHKHKGSPWQPRFKSSTVDDANVLTVMRYIEHRPVALGLARSANQYPYSSFAVRLKNPNHHWMTDPEGYLALGATREACLEDYREHIKINLTGTEIVMIETALTTRHRIAKPTPYSSEQPQNQNKVADDDESNNSKNK